MANDSSRNGLQHRENDMGKIVLKLAAAAAALAISTGASATVFNISLPTLSSFTLSGTITTDNTVGAINVNNITAYNLTANNGTNMLTCSNPTCGIGSGGNVGSALNATATQLTWNFSTAPQPELAFIASNGFICFGPGGGLCNFGGGNGITNHYGNTYAVQNYTGVQVIGRLAAVGSAVPEPATWAMMLVGFGLVGSAMRRRSATSVFATV